MHDISKLLSRVRVNGIGNDSNSSLRNLWEMNPLTDPKFEKSIYDVNDGLFRFKERNLLGEVVYANSDKLVLNVETESLKNAKVGRLVAIESDCPKKEWVIGIVESLSKNRLKKANPTIFSNQNFENTGDADLLNDLSNLVTVHCIATLNVINEGTEFIFSHSIKNVPDMEARAYSVEGENLETFMNVLSLKSDTGAALKIGTFSMSKDTVANLDGNKFFQSHAAILGSMGRSRAVALILEKAAELPTSNVIVFDLNDEYGALNSASHLKVAGPDSLLSDDPELLFLPYWLMNSEEILAIFMDKDESIEPNEAIMFQKMIEEAKKKKLRQDNKMDVLHSFTVDSPVPYSLVSVIKMLEHYNLEMQHEAHGLKQGPLYGRFSQLLARLELKIKNRRFGFLFDYPDSLNEYGSMSSIVKKLMNFEVGEKGVKVIDFSEVPTDILPIVVGMMARIIYNVQFWTKAEERQPLCLVCDEAHLYLPKSTDENSNEKRTLEYFDKIAKEGRRYGISLLLVSQKPSEVSEALLSQCNNIVALGLSNKNDQNALKKFLPNNLNTFNILPILDVGEAIVFGDSVLLPLKIVLDEPEKQNSPKKAVDIWASWSDERKRTDFDKVVESYRKQTRK